ncbi:unnamed protein product [Orchesella dallaii]|uniref:Uncharacterized protein n=1 Tax=Orchesella dallaii TaxID=48710 RepID=A0ABP1QMD7_9HEXA
MANSKESWKQSINSEMQVPKPSLESQFCQMQSDLVSNFLIVYNLHLKIRTETSDCEIEQDKILHLREQWITLDHSSSSALVPFYKVIDEKYESVKAAIKTVKEKMEPYLGVLKSYFGEIVQDELPRSEINKMSPDRLIGAMKQFEAKIE